MLKTIKDTLQIIKKQKVAVAKKGKVEKRDHENKIAPQALKISSGKVKLHQIQVNC